MTIHDTHNVPNDASGEGTSGSSDDSDVRSRRSGADKQTSTHTSHNNTIANTDQKDSGSKDQSHINADQNGQENGHSNVPGNGLRHGALPANLEEDDRAGLVGWLRSILGRKSDESLRQAIEEYIEEAADGDNTSLAFHEKTLIANVLKLRDLNASDVMIPRADIVSFDLKQPAEDFLTLLSENPHSRVPVYKNSADDVLGTIHIKDVLKELAAGNKLDLTPLIRDVPIVSPAMPILDLLLQMRESRKHMVLVIDEFGGIDGLVTIGDLIEAIVGEFYDEHDQDFTPQFITAGDGSIIADARVGINEFEEKVCPVLTEEERTDIDTLGGLVFAISGRIPARGEVLKHAPSGLVFEIIDADPRRIKKMRIQNIPN